ncbi:Hsp33 family molecular chaperone HslO, partial [Bacillus pumilus]
LLPGLSDEEITAIEQAVSAIPPVTTLLDQGLELEDMLKQLLPDVEVLEEMDIMFRCQCSRDRVEQTLVSLGQAELERLI